MDPEGVTPQGLPDGLYRAADERCTMLRMSPFAPIPGILDDLRAGRMVVLLDAPDRENEGDLVVAAEKATPAAVNFMKSQARGEYCVALAPTICDRLRLPPQVAENTSKRATAFTVTVDAKRCRDNGISVEDLARTTRLLGKPATSPDDLVRPGHVHPLRAREGGVLVRAGHTEGSVDLVRMAGLNPAAVIVEVLTRRGGMARERQLTAFARRHGLRMCRISDLIQWRRRKEKLVRRALTLDLPTEAGLFTLHLYRTVIDDATHLALCKGWTPDWDEGLREPVLVRVHSECLTGDAMASLRCDCGSQLRTAMATVQREERGVVLYLRQEGRGIGLENKLRAYALQQKEGMDTVEANLHLGFQADEREYGIGAQILTDLGLRRIRVMSNNPRKFTALAGYGLRIASRVPLVIPPNPENALYLKAKREKLGHLLG